MKIYGTDMETSELKRRVGRLGQVMGAREITFRNGFQHDVKAVELYNDTGLFFTVLIDKGMDISDASFCGRPIAWQCKNGIVGPQYFENSESGFFRGFAGGLIATCGYTQVGTACEEDGVFLGLHDRAHNLPAERYWIEEGFEEGLYTIRLTGLLRQSSLYRENLLIKREITIKQGESRLWLKDTVRNDGYQETPFMLMYHINFGWPVVSENSYVLSPAKQIRSERGEEKKNQSPIHLSAPVPNYTYECWAHDMPKDEKTVRVSIINDKLGFGAYLKYSPQELPTFNTWKMTGEQEYVFAVEPGTNEPEGRVSARKHGRLITLKPLEERSCHLELGVISDRETFSHL